MNPPGRPAPEEYDAFYETYIGLLDDAPLMPRLAAQPEELRDLLSGLGPDGYAYRYLPEKWSVMEVLGHLADAERIFGMRAACIARGETADLPGFAQDDYVAEAAFGDRTIESVLREFELMRAANLEMFRGLSPAHWRRSGRASGSIVSVRAQAWILAGHLEHHLGILRRQYAAAFTA